MSKVLGSTVALYDPSEGRIVALVKGTPLPEWAEGLVHESRLIDDHALSIFDRLAGLGASDDEIAALRVAYDSLDDDEKADVGDDVSDDELREGLAQIRAAAAEHGVTVAEAVAQAQLEHTEPPAPSLSLAAIETMRKDELEAEVVKLREQGVELEIAPPGNKPEIADALRSYLGG